MKSIRMYFALLVVLILTSGCATRSGNSTKLIDYEYKIKSVSVVYNTSKFNDEKMMEKLYRYNFQNIPDYLSKTVTPTFLNAGVNANCSSSVENSLSKNDQILTLVPTAASTTGRVRPGQEARINSGPSIVDPKIRTIV